MRNRSELVLDLRKLGLIDRPGEWSRLDTTVPAPEDLRIEMIGVPEGSPIELALQLESVVEGIYVSGSVRAAAQGQDARTLEDLELPLDVAITELFVYEREPGDEDSYTVDRDRLDLEPAIRDAVVMALPFRPVKDEDEDEDGEDFRYTLGEDLPESVPETDPRWSALKNLLDEKKES
ncbi:YceD family protein [Brevibacterium sp. NPDC049920]|uniref:YceD family protein n=1 Tax=Brevibacterium sp. NPDC049920 TaxID=3155279 RepID=UPI0033E8362B